MQRFGVVAFTLALSLSVASISHATKYTVLLPSPPSPQEPAAVAGNPLYQGSGTNGTNPLHKARALVLNPTELWQGAPATLEVLFNDSLPGDLPPAPKGALVFGVSLFDQASGNAIHQLRAPVTLAVEFDTAVDPNNYIFSSLNESTGAWGEFQKGKPKQGNDGLVCGTTDHFSFFYIAEVPEPSTLTLALAAGVVGIVRRRR